MSSFSLVQIIEYIWPPFRIICLVPPLVSFLSQCVLSLSKFPKVPSKLRNGKEPVLIALNLINASCSSFSLVQGRLIVTTNHLNLAHCTKVMSLQSSKCIFHFPLLFMHEIIESFILWLQLPLLNCSKPLSVKCLVIYMFIPSDWQWYGIAGWWVALFNG